MKWSHIVGGMLVSGASALITQMVMEDTLGNVYEEAGEAAKSDSIVRRIVGQGIIGMVGSAIGVKGLSWAVRKVRGV